MHDWSIIARIKLERSMKCSRHALGCERPYRIDRHEPGLLMPRSSVAAAIETSKVQLAQI
jgi:hypothetical protein